jgi:motility quorum-sensing regulator/GCU-specific mRNA interferase toxin
MEKQKPHYLLKAIQAQMTAPEAMNLTLSALAGIRAAGMAQADALAVVQCLTSADFYKSMTTNADHRVWQDVYHGEWQGVALYIKFQQAGEYFVISFKER